MVRVPLEYRKLLFFRNAWFFRNPGILPHWSWKLLGGENVDDRKCCRNKEFSNCSYHSLPYARICKTRSATHNYSEQMMNVKFRVNLENEIKIKCFPLVLKNQRE